MLFKRLVFSDMLTIILSGALNTYLYWYAYQFSLDQKMIGLVGFGQLLGLLFASLGGGIADRFNKVSFIKIVTLIRLVLILGLYLVLPHVSTGLLILAFMLLSTICSSLLSPTMESLLPQLSQTDDQLYELNARLSSLTQLASLLGVFLSAFYVSFLSLETALLLSLGLGTLSFLPLLGLSLEMATASQSVLTNIKNGLTYLFQTNYIRRLIPIALLMNMTFWTVFLLLPKLSIDQFSFFKSAYSLLELSFALGGIAGGWYFSKKLTKIEDKFKLFWLSLLAQSSCLFLLGLSASLSLPTLSYLGVLLAWTSYAFSNTIVSIVYFSSIQLKVPQDILGSVFGTILTIFSLVNPLAALLSAPLSQIFPINHIILLAAALMFVLSLITSQLKSVQEAFIAP